MPTEVRCFAAKVILKACFKREFLWDPRRYSAICAPIRSCSLSWWRYQLGIDFIAYYLVWIAWSSLRRRFPNHHHLGTPVTMSGTTLWKSETRSLTSPLASNMLSVNSRIPSTARSCAARHTVIRWACQNDQVTARGENDLWSDVGQMQNQLVLILSSHSFQSSLCTVYDDITIWALHWAPCYTSSACRGGRIVHRQPPAHYMTELWLAARDTYFSRSLIFFDAYRITSITSIVLLFVFYIAPIWTVVCAFEHQLETLRLSEITCNASATILVCLRNNHEWSAGFKSLTYT